MKRLYILIVIAIISMIAGAVSSTLINQNGVNVFSISGYNSTYNNDHYGLWLPISSFASHTTTVLDAQQKLNVPFKMPTDDKIQALGMNLVTVLYGGTAENYSIVYLIYGNSPIDPNTMSVGDIVNTGHVVVIQTDSGWTLNDVQSLYSDVKNGISSGDQIAYVNNIPAILSQREIAIYQGTVIYDILVPNTVSTNQLMNIATSMFK
jgi:hypothetical protein